MRYMIGVISLGGSSGTLVYGMYMRAKVLNKDTIYRDISNGAIVPVFDNLHDAEAFVSFLNHYDETYFLKKYDTKETIFKITRFNRNLIMDGIKVPCYDFKAKNQKVRR